MIRRTGIIFLLLLISSCSQLPQKTDQKRSSLWLQHQAAISNINTWNIKARIAIRSDAESATLTLLWHQQDTDYELRLIAPFGQGHYLFRGSAQGVSLSGPGDLFLTAATVEELVYQSLGWNIEPDGLKYWIRGIPKPSISYKRLLLDKQGRISDLEQSGFHISISQYTQSEGISLPEKLSINGEGIQLKLLVQYWEI